MNNLSNLKASLPATCAAITGRMGIKLSFGQPRTNGKTIWVSDLPLNPTENDYYIVLSDLGHEGGHILYTSFNIKADSRYIHELTNALEDVRIEYLLEREFLGMKTYLNKGYEAIIEEKGSVKSDSLPSAISLYMLTHYMMKFNFRDCFAESREDALAVIEAEMPQELWVKIKKLTDTKMPFICSEKSTTKDASKLAHDIVDLIKDYQESKSEESENDAPQDQSNNSESQQESKGQSSASGDESSDENSDKTCSAENRLEEGKDDGQDDAGNSDDPNTKNSHQESNANAELSSNSSSFSDKHDFENETNSTASLSLREKAQDIEDDVSESGSTREVMGNISDLAKELSSTSSNSSNFYEESCFTPDITEYNKIVSNMRPEIHKFRTKLLKHWTSESKARRVVNEDDGEFSIEDALRCSITGESNYLVEKRKVKTKKPAVTILSDFSGSMGEMDESYSPLNLQKSALVSLAETCHQASIPLKLLGFSDMCINLKGFNEPLVKARATIGGMNSVGGTEIVPSFYEGFKSLINRKESKKILIVMTDGYILGWEKDTVISLLQHIKVYYPNIEVYGLGINQDISDIFERGGAIRPDQISDSILEILSQ